jgi:hypothetical protein
MDPPKYKIGTLLLSNYPYNQGMFRDRVLGIIIYIYEKAVPYTKVTVYRYVVEWYDHKTPRTYAEEEIACFINNLCEAAK